MSVHELKTALKTKNFFLNIFLCNEYFKETPMNSLLLTYAFIFNHRFVIAVNKNLDKWAIQND